MKTFARALLILTVGFTPAFSQDIPTASEMVQAAADQGLSDLEPQSETAISDPGAWTFKEITVDTNSDQNKPDSVRVNAQLEAAEDLYIRMGEIQGKTLVQQNILKGGGFGLTGTMAFKRVGTFTRIWEIKFTWDGTVPAGQPLASIPNAVSSTSNEGKALAAALQRQPIEQLEKMRAEADAKRRAEEENIQAMKAKGAKQLAEKQAALVAIANKVRGIWMPYTIVADQGKANSKSDFGGIRIDTINADNSLTITLLKGSKASSPQVQTSGEATDGRLHFKDDTCDVTVEASRNESGEYHMLFGDRKCGGIPQAVAILLESRPPKEIEKFTEMMKNSKEAPATMPELAGPPSAFKRPSEQLLDLNRPLVLRN